MENSNNELFCSICDAPIKDDDEICYKCGSDLTEFEDNTLADNKYPSLNNLSYIYKVLAFLVFVASIVAIYYGGTLLSNSNLKAVGIFLIVYLLIVGVIGIVILFAISEGITWMIDMENNSRVHSRLLYKLVKNKK